VSVHPLLKLIVCQQKPAFPDQHSGAPCFDGVGERNLSEVWPERISEWNEHARKEGQGGKGAGLIDGHKVSLTLLGEKAPQFLFLGELRIAPTGLALRVTVEDGDYRLKHVRKDRAIDGPYHCSLSYEILAAFEASILSCQRISKRNGSRQ
jgi:hypothetical protein